MIKTCSEDLQIDRNQYFTSTQSTIKQAMNEFSRE